MKNRMLGRYEHTIDKKKRMFLPAKIRDCLGEDIYLIKSLSGKCIALYPEEEWEKFEAKLEAIPEITGIRVLRKIYSSMAVVQTDAQGRILIPSDLCEYAGLEKDVVVIGCGKHAEIWSAADREEEAERENDPDLIDLLREIGF